MIATLWHRYRVLIFQFGKFGIVGVICFGIDAGTFTLCKELFGLSIYAARVISFLVAATAGWLGNRLFTYRGATTAHAAHMQWLRFVIVGGAGFVLNYGTYPLLLAHASLIEAHPVLGIACGSIVAMFFNFFATKYLVFK